MRRPLPLRFGTLCTNLLLLGLVTFVCCKKALTPLPAVATAKVRADIAVLTRQADPAAAPVAGLIKGNQINILQLPVRPTEWVRAQMVEERRVSEPGFVKASELGDWSADRADDALRLVLVFERPEPGADAARVDAYLKRLEEWEKRFSATEGWQPAALTMARELLFWASESPSRRSDLLGRTRKLLDRIAGNPPSVEAKAVETRLLALGSERPSAAAGSQALTVSFAEVYALWGRGEYTAALQQVDKILVSSPNHQEAIVWKNRLQAAIAAESSLSTR